MNHGGTSVEYLTSDILPSREFELFSKIYFDSYRVADFEFILNYFFPFLGSVSITNDTCIIRGKFKAKFSNETRRVRKREGGRGMKKFAEERKAGNIRRWQHETLQ